MLLLDIETAPNIAHVWGLWQQNVGINQIQAPGYVMCWAAKWHGERKIHFARCESPTDRAGMLRPIHALLDEADIVVHYNGRKFDIPTLNKEFILHEMTPPSPYKQVDLLAVTRREFRWPSNKLDYVCQQLGLGKKVKHAGHDLWNACMAGDEIAWRKMTAYNRNDVVILERLYDRLMPWIRNHPNRGMYSGRPECTNCGGSELQSRGFAHTLGRRYRRFQCLGCGKWLRGTKAESSQVDIKEDAG